MLLPELTLQSAAVTQVARASAWGEFLRGWNLESGVVICLGLTGALYGIGIRRFRSAAGRRGIAPWRAVSFAAGWLTLALALLSPIHQLGERYFWAHMIPHELLMLVAAPLLILGFPLIATIWALPLGWRRRAGRVSRARPVQIAWRSLTHPLISWTLGAAVLWLWHAPALFQRALESESLHAVQHLSFSSLLCTSGGLCWICTRECGRASPSCISSQP